MQGWVREQVEAAQTPVKRVTRSASDKERTRWESAIDQAIRRKLIDTGEVHANDVDDLPVPHQLRNLIGNRFQVFSKRRLMAKTGEYRRVTHSAAHGREAPVYRITPKGRAELVGSSAEGEKELRKERLLETPRVEASAGSGDLPVARVARPAPPESSPRGSGGRDEAAQLFELPRPGNAHTDPRAA